MGAVTLSVINQMLKDLDHRQNEQANKEAIASNAMLIAPQKNKIALIIIVTVAVTLLLAYGGYLFTQNQQLIAEKNDNNTSVQEIQQNISAQKTLSNEVKPDEIELENGQKVVLIPQPKVTTVSTRSEVTANMPTSKNKPIPSDSVQSIIKKAKQPINEEKAPVITTKAVQDIKNKTLAEESGDITPLKSQASISVSRRQLTTEQLAKQKMTQAEQALSSKNTSKAEKLFEEVLMLKPDNKAARKQLAALWFGRKAYQDALNLLAQGIALDPKYSEFRLMQARIYLTQGYSEQAYQVLQGLTFTHNIEYLATQASVAQQLSKYQQAIKSYQQLIKLQPNEARWWLGLAVAYDSNAQYQLALPAYQSAIAQGNLSASSLDFVQQRLQELRE